MDLSTLFFDFSRSFLFTLATLLPMLNPPAAAPIFLTLTSGIDNNNRARLAKNIAINIFIMLSVAMIAGHVVLDFFGISLPVIRIGGGLLVIATAWRLVSASYSDLENSSQAAIAEVSGWDKISSKAFYPLTFPMICGPGSLSAALTVGATLQTPKTVISLTKLAGAIPAIVTAAFIVYLCLRFAVQFIHKLGVNGTAVVMRLSAFILLCLGVQIVWDGAHELILSLLIEAANQIQKH